MKLIQILSTVLPLSGIVTAVPWRGEVVHEAEKRTSSPTAVAFYDTFDDRTALPISVGQTGAVGIYGAINYKSFSIVSGLLTPLLPPPSMPNFIYGGAAGELTAGEHQFLPANSTVKYFDLKSLAYACSIQSGLEAFPCTIQLAAVQASQFGGQTFVVNLVYNPSLNENGTSAGIVNAYSTATFPATFKGLVSVTANIINELASDTAALFLFDNIKYTAYIQK